MRKLETHSELPSKFDLPSVYFGKYYQTFGIDEIVRLMQPYLQEKTKSSLSLQKQKEMCQTFLQLLIEKIADEGQSQWLPSNLLYIQCKTVQNEKCFTERTYIGLEGRVIKHLARDKKAEWENEWKRGGISYKMEGVVPIDYDYFNVEFSDEINERVKEKGKLWE